MKKIICLFAAFIAAAITANAQCASVLRGKVIDHHDRQPLEFAEIYIKELKKGALTDSSGNYQITGICDGNYTVKFTHLGCEDIITSVLVDGNTVQNFYPEHHLHELGLVDVVVKQEPEKTTVSSYRMKERELEETRGKSLGEALKNITGVSVMQTGSSISKPVIHGLHSNRILILNNGIRQEGQQWGSEHAPEIDPFIANNLTVIKGASSVRYGSDAIAGVILVEPDKLRDSAGIGGALNLVGLSNGRTGIVSGMLEQNFKKLPALSWRLQGTLKKGGTIATPQYYLKNTGMEENNFSAAAGWKKNKYGVEVFYSQFNTTISIMSASHIGNVTDLLNAIKRTEPLEKGEFSYEIERPYQHIEHELFKAKAYLFTGNAGKLSLVYARQYNLRYEYDKHRPLGDSLAGINKPELQFEITSHSADLLWEHNAIKQFTGTIGISGMQQGNTYEGRYFIPNYRNYTGGVYWIERWTKNKLQLEGGLRYDYRHLQVFKYENNVIVSPVYAYQNSSGTVGAIYKFNNHLSSTVNIGSAWRAPGVNELYSDGIHHGAATFEIGDKNLKPEKAVNYIASILYNNQKKWNIELSGYHTTITDFIYLQAQLPPTVTIHGSFPTLKYKQVNATFTGLDAQVNYYIIPQLMITGKASVIRAFNKTMNDYLVQIPPDKFQAELTYNFKSYKKIKNSYISINAVFANKQFRVPENSDYVMPPDSYTLLNFEAGTTIHIKKQPLTIGLGGTNILNTVYRDYMNRFRYYADEMGRNITLRIKMPINS
ncbi:MAG: TonB-dependent receptor [Bacteroidota bacterium]